LARAPAHEPGMAPRNLPGFPNARKVRPKTSFPGGLRPRWRDANNDILEWDARHGRIERYNHLGAHLGEFDPETGEPLKPADPTRKVTP
jgi:hypothetical protein